MSNLVRQENSSIYSVGDRGIPIDYSNLKALYTFGNGAGSTLYDESGNGNDGSITGASWVYDSHFGYSLDFDGTDDYVDTGVGSLDVPVTVAMWLKPDVLNEWLEFFGNFQNTGSDFYIYFNQNGEDIEVTNDLYGSTVNASHGLSTPSWIHLTAIAYNDGTEIYIDGGLKADVGGDSSGGTFSTSNNFKIGDRGDEQFLYDGKIDEVAIYNRALSESEITNIYEKTKP